MTAHELARRLLAGPDLEVKRECDSHDYWRRRLALPVRGADVGEVAWSEYHGADQVLDDGEDDDGERRAVVLLR
jgi:hypothetical protein